MTAEPLELSDTERRYHIAKTRGPHDARQVVEYAEQTARVNCAKYMPDDAPNVIRQAYFRNVILHLLEGDHGERALLRKAMTAQLELACAIVEGRRRA